MGFRVAAHAEGLGGARIAIEEGVDTIEHGLSLHRAPELLARMAERGIVLVPTLSTFHDLAERFADDFAPRLVEQAKRQAEDAAADARRGAGRRGHARDGLRQRSARRERQRAGPAWPTRGLGAAAAIRAATAGSATALGLADDRRHDRGRPRRRPPRRRRRPARRIRRSCSIRRASCSCSRTAGSSPGREPGGAVGRSGVSERAPAPRGRAPVGAVAEASAAASTLTDYLALARARTRAHASPTTPRCGAGRSTTSRRSGRRSSTTTRSRCAGRGTGSLGAREMPGARWFEGAELNYAEALFGRRRRRPAGAPVPVGAAPAAARSSGAELDDSVAAAAAGLRRLGVGRGDRVVGRHPEHPRGGHRPAGVREHRGDLVELLARLRDAEPGRPLRPDRTDGPDRRRRLHLRRQARSIAATVIDELRAALPTLRADGPDPVPRPGARRRRPGRDVVGGPRRRPGRAAHLRAVPFDHPLWVLYSSGTTGLPKAIVHGHGGIVLEHAKAIGLHVRHPAGDRMFWFTTTGWMMWNFLRRLDARRWRRRCCTTAAPATRTSTSCGSWRRGRGSACSGRAPRSSRACMKAASGRARRTTCRALRAIGSTGSPLAVEVFGWVYDAVKPDVWLVSMSGGTDVVQRVRRRLPAAAGPRRRAPGARPRREGRGVRPGRAGRSSARPASWS